MEKLDNFFEKINGGYFCIIAVVILLVLSLTAQSIYLQTDPNFGMFTNYVSDLGAGPPVVKLIMLLLGIIGGGLLILIVLFIGTDLRHKNENPTLIKLVVLLGILAGLWFLLLGFFPYDPVLSFSFEMHNIIALFCSSTLAVTFFLYAFIEYKNSEIPKKLAPVTIIVAALYGTFITAFAIVIYTPISPHPFNYAIEWIAFFSLFFWLIIHGLYFIREKK